MRQTAPRSDAAALGTGVRPCKRPWPLTHSRNGGLNELKGSMGFFPECMWDTLSTLPRCTHAKPKSYRHRGRGLVYQGWSNRDGGSPKPLRTLSLGGMARSGRAERRLVAANEACAVGLIDSDFVNFRPDLVPPSGISPLPSSNPRGWHTLLLIGPSHEK